MTAHPLFDRVDELSYWPADGPLMNDDVGVNDALMREWLETHTWRLDLCRDGTLSLRERGQKSFNGVAIPVYRATSDEPLRLVQTVMCSRGGPGSEDPRLTHEGGTRFQFSWLNLPGTLWQVGAVQRIIHLFLTVDPERASEEARHLNKVLDDAMFEWAGR